MARFKIEIPDSKLDFILDLFNSFSFLKYQSIDPEPQEFDNKEDLQEASEQLQQQHQQEKLAQLNELRNTINSIQSSRIDNQSASPSILFRFPHGTEIGAIKVSNLNHLQSTIERYYRTKIKDINFKASINNEGYEMDKFEVFIVLADNSEIKAGYCNQKLK